MLKVRNLKIVYGDRLIFNNVNAEFKRGTITVIQGKSGSGKSSLLNVLGLMQSAFNYEYTFDDTDVTKFNEAQRADFRLHNVGFVFQRSNLIQEFTARQNLIVPMSITNQQDIEKKADDLIKYVGLEEVKNNFPGNLSGGEEQRLAIARAIANDADIILADEPTASLDVDNSKIVLELFRKLAHELNKIVILVSHSELVPKYADAICEIKEQDIVITKTAETVKSPYPLENNKATLKKRNPFRFVKFYSMKRSGDKMLNRVFIAVTALVAAAAILSTNFGSNLVAQEMQRVNSIADKSILVVNNTLDLEGKAGRMGYQEALPISESEINGIKGLKDVGSVYEWYTFSSEGVDMQKQTSLARIRVGTTTSSIAEKEYSNSFSGGTAIQGERFSVVPLYAEEYTSIYDILEYKSASDAKTGLLLTESLAFKLTTNPQTLVNSIIDVTCFVPFKMADAKISDSKGEENTVSLVFYRLVTIRSTVTGIIAGNYSPWNYDRIAEADLIFMNYSLMQDTIAKTINENLSSDEYEGVIEKALGPTSLVIFADEFSAVANLKTKINEISESFNVISHSTTIGDIADNSAGTKTILIAVTVVFIVVVAILFTILFFLKNRARKKEFGILKAIGLTKANIMYLSAAEMIKLALPAFVVSIVLAVLLMILGNSVGIFNSEITTNPFSITTISILIGFLVCVVLVVISGVFPAYTTSRVEPIEAIRQISK
ncbi:MAG: ABC transporter ATP-binding protein/permease [Dehalococcoidia bacterium]|nr:ABC transporter ATP-binding protein/permease [Dehalococcoidia bacterium]